MLWGNKNHKQMNYASITVSNVMIKTHLVETLEFISSFGNVKIQ